MANRVGSYYPKGGHSATQTELKVNITMLRIRRNYLQISSYEQT